MITPEIKKMTQQMSVKDKVRLLMSDHNLRCDTQHQKWLLTSQEKQIMIDDIYKEKKGAILNDVLDKFNFCLLMMIEVRGSYERFRLKQIIFVMMTMIMHTVSEAEDAIGQMIYDLVTSQIKGRKKADTKYEELYAKYTKQNWSYLKKFSCMRSDDRKIQGANPRLQEVIIVTVASIKIYRSKKHIVDYIVETAEVNLIADSTRQEIKEYDEGVEDFLSLAKMYTKIYTEFQEKGFIQISDPTDKRFFDIAKDIDKACELTDEEKQSAENSAIELLEKSSKINFNCG